MKRRTLKTETETMSVEMEISSSQKTLDKFSEQYAKPRVIKGEAAHVGVEVELRSCINYQTTAITVKVSVPVEASEDEILVGGDYALSLANAAIDKKLAMLTRYMEHLQEMKARGEKKWPK